MKDNEKDAVLHYYLDDPDHFSCSGCKFEVKPSDCRGCPVYCQGGFDPND